MIPPETPVGSRVRVYVVQGDESTAWLGRTVTTVDEYVTVRGDLTSGCARVPTSHVEPIGAKPFPPSPTKFTCPHCQREFER